MCLHVQFKSRPEIANRNHSVRDFWRFAYLPLKIGSDVESARQPTTTTNTPFCVLNSSSTNSAAAAAGHQFPHKIPILELCEAARCPLVHLSSVHSLMRIVWQRDGKHMMSSTALLAELISDGHATLASLNLQLNSEHECWTAFWTLNWTLLYWLNAE